MIPHPCLSLPVYEQDSIPSALEFVFGGRGAGERLMWAHLGPWEEGDAGPQEALSTGHQLCTQVLGSQLWSHHEAQAHAHSAPCWPCCT